MIYYSYNDPIPDHSKKIEVAFKYIDNAVGYSYDFYWGAGTQIIGYKYL